MNSARPLALTCSIALHAVLLAWLMAPSSPPKIQAWQAIDIRMAAMSSPESPQAHTAEPKAPPVLVKPVNPDRRETWPKEALKRTETPAKPATETPPSTGLQIPQTKETVTALTEPVYNAANLHNMPPAYPESARARGIEGKVILEVTVTVEGTARQVTVVHSSGYALLDNTARDAIRDWRFIPARRGDKVLETKIEIPVEFRLE